MNRSTSSYFAVLCIVLIFGITGCASKLKVIYPEDNELISGQSGDLTGNFVKISINASIEKVWPSLICVLGQHAFFINIDGSSQEEKKLAYVDRITVNLEKQYVMVELPYQVTVQKVSENETLLNIICRWDCITNENYRGSEKKKFDNLKDSMLTEAYILADRVNVQSNSSDIWKNLREGKKDETNSN